MPAPISIADQTNSGNIAQLGAGTAANALRVVMASNDALHAAIGDPEDTAWDGMTASASLISIMKACYAQLVIIAANTDTGG